MNNTGQVEQTLFFSPNRLTPSIAKPNLTFHGFEANSGHLVSTCNQALLSGTC
jgi:hypothetical protein